MSSQSSADFDASWVPTKGGVPLPTYDGYQRLVDEDIKPKADVEGEREWAVENLSQKIGEFGRARRALLSCLLAIWRLSRFTETGWTDRKWCDLLSAWLVRLDLLFRLKLTDLRFVVPLSRYLRIKS